MIEMPLENGVAIRVATTLPYLSPELLSGEEPDEQSDIFSLGVILYEMLTGVNPFRKKTAIKTVYALISDECTPISDHSSNVPLLLQQTVEQMLAKKREDRLLSVYELLRRLHVVVRAELEDQGG
jgi:serine/threonine-protein kinase